MSRRKASRLLTVEGVQHDLRDTAVFRIIGSIDASSISELEGQINGEIKTGRKCVVLDLSGTEFLSSAGIGLLLSSKETLREYGGDLLLMNVAEEISEVLEAMNLDKYFRTIDSLKEIEEANT